MYKGLQQIAESQKGCRSINPDAGLPCCIGARCWELFFDPVPSLHLQLRMSNLLFERLRAGQKDKRSYKFIILPFKMANIKVQSCYTSFMKPIVECRTSQFKRELN